MAVGKVLSPQPKIEFEALCLDCRKRHHVEGTPATWLTRMEDWRQKHIDHRIEFRSRRRRLPRGLDDSKFTNESLPWWMRFRENADIKTAYAASAALTISLASLASSATFVAGRESTAIVNTSNLYLGYLLGGKITTGTTPTAGQIQIWLYAAFNDTPAYPNTITGSDAAVTLTSADIRNSGLAFFNAAVTSTTSDQAYPFRPLSISAAFGDIIPKRWGAFVTHSTVAALNATGGNHVLDYTGAYITS